MSTEDKENYYILEEENRNLEEEEGPRNFASYNLEEEEPTDTGAQNSSQEKEISATGLMLRIMTNPVEGWKKLRRSKVSLESLQAGCFYPLLALVALSRFAEFFYSVNITLKQVVTQAVVSFVAYFFGFYCVQMIMSWVLPKDMVEKFDTDYGKKYILMSMSTLALFSILTNLLPMIGPILIFLPLWTLYIMFKGVRFFKFAQNQEMKFYVYVASATIGMPLIVEWILDTVMPY